MQPAMPAHANGYTVRTATHRLAWLALSLVAATLVVIQVTRHGIGSPRG